LSDDETKLIALYNNTEYGALVSEADIGDLYKDDFKALSDIVRGLKATVFETDPDKVFSLTIKAYVVPTYSDKYIQLSVENDAFEILSWALHRKTENDVTADPDDEKQEEQDKQHTVPTKHDIAEGKEFSTPPSCGSSQSNANKAD